MAYIPQRISAFRDPGGLCHDHQSSSSWLRRYRRAKRRQWLSLIVP